MKPPEPRRTISVDEAVSRVLGSVPRGGETETVMLDEALGRVLAAEVRCAADVPEADNSAMDGFAVRAADLASARTLRLVGESLAGVPFTGVLGSGQTARVMTGGLVPPGADAVVPVERTSGFEPLEGGSIRFEEAPEPGANIRRRGDVRRRGDLLLAKGTRLRPAQIGVLAQQGWARVPVGRRPRVAILPTGDEVVPVEAVPGPGQVRNSNAHALAAQVLLAGGVPSLLPILRDREGDVRDRLEAALRAHDLLCTIGGVSMGTKDLVRPAFEALGGQALVESIAVKPGKPTLFGHCELGGRASFLLGLPGNPASAFTIFALLGAPWVLVFQGMDAGEAAGRWRGRLRVREAAANPRLQVLPAQAVVDESGAELQEVPQKGSADLFSLAEGDALCFVPPAAVPRDGDVVEWLRLP